MAYHDQWYRNASWKAQEPGMVASLGGRVGHAVDKVRLAHATWTVQEVEGQILLRSPHSANEGIIIDYIIKGSLDEKLPSYGV